MNSGQPQICFWRWLPRGARHWHFHIAPDIVPSTACITVDWPPNWGAMSLVDHCFSQITSREGLHIVLNGHSSSKHPMNASTPQWSVLWPLLWNIYFIGILQHIPHLTFTCKIEQQAETIEHINSTLDNILSWSRLWQVSLAPDLAKHYNIQLGGSYLKFLEEIEMILISTKAWPTQDTSATMKKAANKIAYARRKSHLLHATGCETLYKFQVKPVLEYCPLVWSLCPPSYLSVLDKIQNRTKRLIQRKHQNNLLH